MTPNIFWEIFSYTSNWNLKLNLLFVCITGLYLYLTHNKISKKQQSIFVLAMLIYYIAIGSPLDLIGHDLFSMHMLQMSLLYFVIPPLLLIGVPEFIWLWFLKPKIVRSMLKVLTRPLLSLICFNGTISLYHLPKVFDAIMNSYALHIISHFLLFIFALVMWWPIIAPVKSLDRLQPLHKLGLVFANGILLTPACALITFTNHVMFQKYAQISELVPIIVPLHDQQLGGVIMKIVQEIVYIIAIAILLSKWMKKEREKELREFHNIQEWQNSHLS